MRPGTSRAVFLDRDGVLNPNVYYADTSNWEAPRTAAEFRLNPDVLPALHRLRDAGFLLFLVSNQPNVAKGKSRPGALESMHAHLEAALAEVKIRLTDAFYCVHHPEFTGACLCRKPSPHFLLQASSTHSLLLSECWMLGDRITDMQCGRNAGVRTGWIRTGQERAEPTAALCDITANNLGEAVEQILTGSLKQG